MTTIILDSTKKPSVDTRRSGHGPADERAAVTSIARTSELEPRSFVVGTLPGDVYHSNYLGYLEFCWSQHYVPILTPDILWYTLLCEIAGVIRTDPEAVRSLFSETAEKQRIIVMTDDPEVLPLDLIVDQLRRLCTQRGRQLPAHLLHDDRLMPVLPITRRSAMRYHPTTRMA